MLRLNSQRGSYLGQLRGEITFGLVDVHAHSKHEVSHLVNFSMQFGEYAAVLRRDQDIIGPLNLGANAREGRYGSPQRNRRTNR